MISQSHLLIRRRLSSHAKIPLFFAFLKPFSSLPLPQPQPQPPPQLPPPSDSPKPTSLSARMSFVFDQIDAIERDRQEKDQTLQRIRAWRESKRITTPNPQSPVESLNSEELKELDTNDENGGLLSKKKVELVHPWPEWIELMERLVQQNYFDHKRKDEDKMIEDLGFNLAEAADEEGFDFTRDLKTVLNAVLNFGRDRFDILRSLSRQDLQVLVGYGCPSTDKRVNFSAKVLRKHVHLDEGDVCSSCSLRSSCEKAYLLTNKEDEARTIDVMRVLLTFGFDPINGSVVNKSLLKIKSVKTVIRKLLHQVVKLSAVPIDPNLPPPIIKKPPPKVKQPPPPPRKRVGRDDIEMKKGDWLCTKCDFMNFAKNTVCLQCDAKRPKRQLLPGEWECPQCNFLNYRRNVVCFHCECKRPPDDFMENHMQERQRGSRVRTEKILVRKEVSNAWNFDFDDDESDGADVAAFEYADSGKIDEDFPLDKGSDEIRVTKMYEKDYTAYRPMKPETGFNDFDDEDDDLENYELDTQNETQKISRINLSELENSSDSDNSGSMDNNGLAHRRMSLQNGKKSSTPTRGKKALSRSRDAEFDFGSDDDLPIHPNWKSSHAANSRQNTRSRGALSYGSDDDLGFSSGDDSSIDETFRSRNNSRNKLSSNGRGKGRGRGARNQQFSDLESEDDLDFVRRNPNSSKSSRRGGRGNGRSDRQMSNAREGDSQRFSGPRARRSNDQQRGRSNNYNNQGDSYLDDERFKRPRVNVR